MTANEDRRLCTPNIIKYSPTTIKYSPTIKQSEKNAFSLSTSNNDKNIISLFIELYYLS